MGGANEKVMPAEKKGTDGRLIGGYRWHINKEKGEVHIHDDKKSLVVVWPDSLSFRIHWRELHAIRGRMDPGEECALIGLTKDPGNGRSPGVLVFRKTKAGEIETEMEEYDATAAYDFEVRRSQDLEEMEQWVQENC